MFAIGTAPRFLRIYFHASQLSASEKRISSEVDLLVGNPARAKEKLGWQPQTAFTDLVKIMVQADFAAEESHAATLPVA